VYDLKFTSIKILFLFVIVRQPSRFAAVSEPKESEKSKKPKNRSVREFFGQDEYCYIMDAKNNGNIGRYLNVSPHDSCIAIVQKCFSLKRTFDKEILN
jgi:hypothetical protein